MKQKLYPDPYGLDTWDQDNAGRVIVHLVNSEHFHEITGTEPPPTPIDAQVYTKHGFPWFELYDENRGDVAPPEQLTTVKTIAEHDRERGITTEGLESLEVTGTQIKKLSHED